MRYQRACRRGSEARGFGFLRKPRARTDVYNGVAGRAGIGAELEGVGALRYHTPRYEDSAVISLLVWRNTTYHKGRTILALSAITFAVVLIFMQLALYDTCEISAVVVTDMLDFDALLLSAQYMSLQEPGTVPQTRLYQVVQEPGVQSVSPVYFGAVPWRNVEDGSRHTMMVLGVAPGDPVFVSPEIRAGLPLLQQTDSALMDRRMLPRFGPVHVNLVSEAGNHSLEVAGLFSNGGGFGAGGVIIVGDRTFNRLGYPLNRPTLGAIKLKPGEDLQATVSALRENLPPDVQVLTRAEHAAREKNYWVNVKPIGIIFQSGVMIGMIVAAMILYQVLANDIARRMKEYATLKAIGYSDLHINWLVMQQAFLLMGMSYLAGLVMAYGLYDVMARGTGFPMGMTFARAALVFLLTLAMSLASGLMALRTLRAADPADLF